MDNQTATRYRLYHVKENIYRVRLYVGRRFVIDFKMYAGVCPHSMGWFSLETMGFSPTTDIPLKMRQEIERRTLRHLETRKEG